MTNLFKPSTPAMPAPTPPPVMPTPNGPAEMAARARALAEARMRAGRQSTILTGASTGDYNGTKLGAD